MTEKLIKKILIANRSEIALRIMKTAKRLNIQCVAIYSTSDQLSLHVQEADEAYALHADNAADSYLNIEKIISIAKQSACDAIHPGYGFLAENAAFSLACANNGIIFIGPKPETIDLMGDKATAKSFSKQQGIPVIPGEENIEQDLTTFKIKAAEIGAPLLLKASAGGGGKGMKLVNDLSEVESAYHSAKREALASFGNDNLLIEKYFDKARHIEIQVLADQYGNVVHLFDRDCSLQRRHQKVIEEAPAFGLSETCRKAMQNCAIKLCKAIQYQGVGTLEFLVDEKENFYLMEMNTRLQVEHAVSEQITGIDLVEQQILVAQGKKLNLQQSDIKITGHSIEARLYAEQCKHNFLPASGLIENSQLPKQSHVTRIDHALFNGQAITSLYDPMIAKIACWGKDRATAITNLYNSLSNTHIIGVETNRNFLKACLAHKDFANNHISTKFIENNIEALNSDDHIDIGEMITRIAALFSLSQKIASLENAKETQQSYSPWFSNDNWRLNTDANNAFFIAFNGDTFSTANLSKLKNSFSLSNCLFNSKQQTLTACWSNKSDKQDSGLLKLSLHNSNKNTLAELNISSYQGDFNFTIHNVDTGKIKKSNINTDNNYLAPLNGRVIAVNVSEGDEVVSGQELIVLEAMKMEHILKARSDGKINALNVTLNQQVEANQLLLQMENK